MIDYLGRFSSCSWQSYSIEEHSKNWFVKYRSTEICVTRHRKTRLLTGSICPISDNSETDNSEQTIRSTNLLKEIYQSFQVLVIVITYIFVLSALKIGSGYVYGRQPYTYRSRLYIRQLQIWSKYMPYL